MAAPGESGTGTIEPINPHLADQEVTELQQNLVAEIRERGGPDDIYAVWLSPRQRYANLVRTLEARQFPEMPDVMDGYEDDCLFLALVDTRPGIERLVHAFRLSVPREDRDEGLQIVLLDDLVRSQQGLSEEELLAHYAERNINVNSEAVSVESNFRIGDKVETTNGLRVSDLGYIAIFKHLVAEGNAKVVFAHLNDSAVASLGAIGVTDEPIAGRQNLQTPTVAEGGLSFDPKYHPVAIPTSPENRAIFEQLTPLAAPELDLTQV